MHVVNVAVNDVEYEPEMFGATLADASPEAAANLSQVVAVGCLCNSAIVGGGKEGGSGRSIMGNETGNASVQLHTSCRLLISTRRRCPAILGRHHIGRFLA